MGDMTKIEWTDATWNPVTGCTKVSPGCDHCYAEGIYNRFHGPGSFDTVRLMPDRLDQPLRWRKPRRVFVNSMSDLFHERVRDDYIAQVFAMMARADRHTYQVLTKRHARMRSLLNSARWPELLTASGLWPYYADPERPLDNVWLGVSVEDQHWADIRVPALLETPAAVRFLSCEPLMGPVDLVFNHCAEHDTAGGFCTFSCPQRQRIDWVIVGGESGPKARPMDPEWVEKVRDDCQASDTAFFFKQWGSHDEHGKRMSKHAAGRTLDGRTWDEYPVAS